MGLLAKLLTLPLAPVRGVIVLAEQLEQEADRQWRDPTSVRQEIAAVDAAFEAGELSAQERDERQDALVARLLPPRAGS